MHTMVIKTAEYGEARIHYNSDWSGIAHINWTDASGPQEASVPAALLRTLGGKAAVSAISRKIEDALEDAWDDVEQEFVSDDKKG